MEQIFVYIGAAGGLAGIAAILTVFANYLKHKRESHLETLQVQLQAMQVDSKNQTDAFQAQIAAFQAQIQAMQTQMQIMQAGFDSQLKGLTESVNSWKCLWEASTQEIRELKMEIKELRSEIDKLRTENAELKGQLKEHYNLA